MSSCFGRPYPTPLLEWDKDRVGGTPEVETPAGGGA